MNFFCYKIRWPWFFSGIIENETHSSGKLVMVEWEDALVAVARALQSAKEIELAAIVGGFADAEVSLLIQATHIVI
jgi:hypothetical protein